MRPWFAPSSLFALGALVHCARAPLVPSVRTNSIAIATPSPRSLPPPRALDRPACASTVELERSFVPTYSPDHELYPEVPRDAACTQPHDARARIARLDHAIASLGPSDSLEHIRASFRSLFAHPCFALADLFGPSVRVHSPAGLQTWWNAGGHAWLRSLVDFSIHPERPRRARITLPPTERWHLSRRAFGQQPIARFLCPDGDTQCGTSAASRLRRIESLSIARDPFDLSPASATPDALAEAARLKADNCLYAIEGAPRIDRFGEWLSCMRDNRLSRRFRFALGAYREPSGWLVLSGYATTAISLDTGAAYQQSVTRVEHSPLVAEDTAAFRTTLARIVLDRERVRDFAIALVAGYYGETDTRDAVRATVPPNVTWRRGDRYPPVVEHHASRSHAPWFQWRWFANGCEIARGLLASRHAHHHITFALLDAALEGHTPVVFAQHTSALAPEDPMQSVYEWAASHATPR